MVEPSFELRSARCRARNYCVIPHTKKTKHRHMHTQNTTTADYKNDHKFLPTLLQWDSAIPPFKKWGLFQGLAI